MLARCPNIIYLSSVKRKHGFANSIDVFTIINVIKYKIDSFNLIFDLFRVKIAPGAIVCNECELMGDITIGSRTVVHPKARILAVSGPIVIGENNIIEEQVEIINKFVNC